jgi:hypothetical protein
MRSPPAQRISVYGVEEGLRDGFEEVVRGEVGLPEALAGAEELVAGGAGDDEVFREVDAADRVEARSQSINLHNTTQHLVCATYPQMNGSPVV